VCSPEEQGRCLEWQRRRGSSTVRIVVSRWAALRKEIEGKECRLTVSKFLLAILAVAMGALSGTEAIAADRGVLCGHLEVGKIGGGGLQIENSNVS
jgi:hypothetical protein